MEKNEFSEEEERENKLLEDSDMENEEVVDSTKENLNPESVDIDVDTVKDDLEADKCSGKSFLFDFD